MSLSVRAEHRFGDFRLDVGFEAPGGVTVLFGPSGCGKSTVLNVVAGLLRPERGRVVLTERTLLDTGAGVSLPPEQRRCGVVFQDARLLPHLSVETNLRYGARRAPAGSMGPGFDEVVALLGIEALLSRRPRTLSGGERQRVAIGRALLSRPRLLLMDEPLASLDAPRRAEILPFLERLRGALDLPLLYVTHALDEVDRLADTLVLMEAGRVSACGPVEALTARTDLEVLSARRDAGVVLGCTVAGHDAGRGLTRLAFPGGALVVPLRSEAVGTGLRVRVRARDVALAMTRPERMSSHNILAATVAGIAPAGPHEAFVSLDLGATFLYARLTQDSVARLGLANGIEVYAVLKSTMLTR